jgi:ribosomal 50S subunit-associated protein YjgA (DUF615 family)
MSQSYTNTALLIDDNTDFGAVENLTKKVIRDGEEALLLAMLEMATEDFQKYILAIRRAKRCSERRRSGF